MTKILSQVSNGVERLTFGKHSSLEQAAESLGKVGVSLSDLKSIPILVGRQADSMHQYFRGLEITSTTKSMSEEYPAMVKVKGTYFRQNSADHLSEYGSREGQWVPGPKTNYSFNEVITRDN